MFYTGTCFLFTRTSANGSSARDYCESVGGQLAVFNKDVEHWFAYTMVLKLLTGKYERGDRRDRERVQRKIWKNSEYDQEIPLSQTADYPVAPRGRAAQTSRDTRKTN